MEKGENIRDWLWVEDHAHAIDLIFHQGKCGETYNIGGHNEWKNIDLVNLLCDIMDRKLGNTIGKSRELITYVKDRAGHDLRYAIDASKIQNELGFLGNHPVIFEEGLEKTVDWYLENEDWLKDVTVVVTIKITMINIIIKNGYFRKAISKKEVLIDPISPGFTY